MTTVPSALIRRIARIEARELPAYNAGLSSDAVRQRYGVDTIARLGSNENPFGPSPAVGIALRAFARLGHRAEDTAVNRVRRAGHVRQPPGRPQTLHLAFRKQDLEV